MVFFKILHNYKGIFGCGSLAASAAVIAINKKFNNNNDDEQQQQHNIVKHQKQLLLDRDQGILEEKIHRARQAVSRYMAISGAPGCSVGVTKNGRPIWTEGFGFADVESGTPCTGASVMRIASISKCLTATIAARLVEMGRLDLDKSIHEYLSEEDFPKKKFNGKEAVITARQLLSHTSGVRHYPKKDENAPDSTDPVEFMSNTRYKSVTEALVMFKADPLLCAPGTQYHYTTHGFTLLSAVLEKVAGGDGKDKEFKQQLDGLFRRLNMWNTRVDDAQESIVIHRTRYYKRNGSHRLENVREVDNSYKLAGGGILSNVGDLLNFANAILYSYQALSDCCAAGVVRKPLLLQPTTIRQMWTQHSEHIDEKSGKKLGEYGLGWSLGSPTAAAAADDWLNGDNGQQQQKQRHREFDPREYWYHSGGAVGTSSIVLIRPTTSGTDAADNIQTLLPPAGVCIAILVNCQDCPCRTLALELARIFAEDEDGKWW